MQPKAKICGISTPEVAFAALDDNAGIKADLLGFIHFEKSPRHITLDTMAELMSVIRAKTDKARLVSVVVDPSDDLLAQLNHVVKPDLIQLHGHETPKRVSEIASRWGVPLIKAISVRDASDLSVAPHYEPHVEYLMFDAKTPEGSPLPGGLGLSFDWALMRQFVGKKDWFLAGGLTPANVATAIHASGAPMVDVSSGVEYAPGVKDVGLISDFLRAVKSL